MKYRRFKKNINFSKKGSSDTRKDKYKKDERESKSGRIDKFKIKCYNCDSMGYFSTECRKAKSNKSKGKALITESNDWMDSSDSDEEVNYALMANVDNDSSLSYEKVQNTVYDFDIENMSELKSFLKNLHMSFKNLTL